MLLLEVQLLNAVLPNILYGDPNFSSELYIEYDMKEVVVNIFSTKFLSNKIV